MPRVVPEYKEEARNRIMASTIRALITKGYSKTTMSDIADEVGVSKATLYLYYPTKEALMMAVAEYMVEMVKKNLLGQKYLEDIRQISSPEFYQGIVDLMSSLVPNDLIFEMATATSKDKPTRDLINVYYAVIEYFESIADDLIKRGVVKGDVDRESLVMGIMALQDGLTMAEKMGVSPEKVRRAWSYTMNILLDGLSPS